MSLISELLEDVPQIIRDKEVLCPGFIPDDVVGRSDQLRQIVPEFRPLRNKQRAGHVILKGFNGSGKTVTVRNILRVTRAKADFEEIFVEGTKGTKSYIAMRKLLAAAGIDLTKKDESIETLRVLLDEHFTELKARGIPSVIVFDEIDLFMVKPLNEIINALVRGDNLVSIVGTTNDLNIMTKIDDPRIESAFKPTEVLFPPYTADELRDILDARVVTALYPNTVEPEVIPLCGAIAAATHNGDARHAIALLNKAADVCIADKREKITEADVRAAEMGIDEEEFENIKTFLSPRHKAMLSELLSIKEIRRADLKSRSDAGLQTKPVSLPTFAKDLKLLESLGLVHLWSRGRGRGQGAEWMVSLNEDVDKKRLVDFLAGE
jgi:cell division control protein 6